MGENLSSYIYDRAQLASLAGRSALRGLNNPASPMSGPKFWQTIDMIIIRPSCSATHSVPDQRQAIQPQLTPETQGEQ